jgi:hypothetical protein
MQEPSPGYEERARIAAVVPAESEGSGNAPSGFNASGVGAAEEDKRPAEVDEKQHPGPTIPEAREEAGTTGAVDASVTVGTAAWPAHASCVGEDRDDEHAGPGDGPGDAGLCGNAGGGSQR